MNLFRPIHHTFAPLADREQRRLALRLLLHPSRWKGQTAARDILRGELNKRCGGETFLFASGREALFAFLHACAFPAGSEIIIQAFTCVVVPNAIRAAGLTPVYADMEKETLNLEPGAVEALITPRTKAVICQHTFGIPADTDRLRTICDAQGLLLVEDCAHILPDARGPMDVMSRGDAFLLSFGRDKAVSGVTGGAVIVRNRTTICDALRTQEQQATEFPDGTIKRLLLYPLLYALARPLYGIGIGKVFLFLMNKLGLLLSIVTREEKHGRQGEALHAMPEACAALVMGQLRNLAAINDHRRTLVKLFLEACAEHGWPVLHGIRPDLPLQKYPLFVRNAEEIRTRLKRHNIHLHDGWTGCVVCPTSVAVDETGYRQGSDPRAEEACTEILSLPTHPGTAVQDAKRLVSVLRPFLERRQPDPTPDH
ncbi:MAG: aminotransferase class I/II-fold pyridoxal phosphate-dependent enzyme [Candidatus Peribacteraceae bacterium]|nr:aminotransferase class I/II-fold pyridoxal phosphate-dependent enzyme [Candidatus Peribacteraceae bacterium]